MFKSANILFLAATVGSTSSADAQESVAPSLLIDTFLEVCPVAMTDFNRSLPSLEAGGWRVGMVVKNTDTFTSVNLSSPDGNLSANLQHYNFGQGLFEQCSVTGYTKFQQQDVRLILDKFPSATGKVLNLDEGQFSGLWLLADQKQFTSLNVLSREHSASIVTMRTSYSPPIEVQP